MTELTPDISIISTGAGEAERPVAVKINGTSYSPAAVADAVRDVVWLRAMFSDLRAALGLSEEAPTGLVVSVVTGQRNELHQTKLQLDEERQQRELIEAANTGQRLRLRALVGARDGEDSVLVLINHLEALRSVMHLAPDATTAAVVHQVWALQQHAKGNITIPEPLARLVRCLRADMDAARAVETFETQNLPRAIRERVQAALTGHRLETRANLLIALDACKELVPVEPEEEVTNAS